MYFYWEFVSLGEFADFFVQSFYREFNPDAFGVFFAGMMNLKNKRQARKAELFERFYLRPFQQYLFPGRAINVHFNPVIENFQNGKRPACNHFFFPEANGFSRQNLPVCLVRIGCNATAQATDGQFPFRHDDLSMVFAV